MAEKAQQPKDAEQQQKDAEQRRIKQLDRDPWLTGSTIAAARCLARMTVPLSRKRRTGQVAWGEKTPIADLLAQAREEAFLQNPKGF